MTRDPIFISLGTSDTLFFSLPRLPTSARRSGHIFAHPVHQDEYMAMLCFRNGSLARQRVRDEFCGGDWTEFGKCIRETSRDVDFLGLYHYEPEIQPRNGRVVRMEDGRVVEAFSEPRANARAIAVSQALLMKHYYHDLMIKGDADRDVVVCGGASRSSELLQVFSDVFGRRVSVLGDASTSAAGMGGVYRAMYGMWRQQSGKGFDEFLETLGPSSSTAASFSPLPGSADQMATAEQTFSKLLKDFL